MDDPFFGTDKQDPGFKENIHFVVAIETNKSGSPPTGALCSKCGHEPHQIAYTLKNSAIHVLCRNCWYIAEILRYLRDWSLPENVRHMITHDLEKMHERLRAQALIRADARNEEYARRSPSQLPNVISNEPPQKKQKRASGRTESESEDEILSNLVFEPA